MTTFLIDGDGEIWDGNSRQLRVAYDSPYSGGEFSTYAINNLGFVGVCVYAQSCQIIVGSGHVMQEAALALYDWLRGQKFDRYVVSQANGEGSLRLVTNPEDIFQIAHELADQAHSNSANAYFQNQVAVPSKPVVRKLQDLISNRTLDLSNEHDLNELRQHLAEAFGGRHIVAKMQPDSGLITFGQIGQDLFSAYGSWRQDAIDAPIRELPDAPYGKWVEESYIQALLSGKPLHQEVDAIVRWPHAGKARMRYERTILPFLDAQGLPALISGTSVNNTIDLRLKVAG